MMMVITKGEINLEQKEMDTETAEALLEGNGEMIEDQVACLPLVEVVLVLDGEEEEIVEM